ncbi:hypothetical protein AB0M79_25410 [Polymorphospora sp. NPDC051019]|uniref:hypothetical protein n=1 Tax=Polymorphospora sp. NPDC051019 TaxID=3155725 RepID=UPI0034180252
MSALLTAFGLFLGGCFVGAGLLALVTGAAPPFPGASRGFAVLCLLNGLGLTLVQVAAHTTGAVALISMAIAIGSICLGISLVTHDALMSWDKARNWGKGRKRNSAG